jgi:type IV secretory pathway VirB10-like protein
MPAVQRASAPMLILIAFIFLGGIAFGAVAALTQPRKEVAKATTADTPPPTEPEQTPPQPLPPPSEPIKKAEPKPEAKKPDPKPAAKPEPKKPEAKKPEAKKPDVPKAEPISYEKQVFPVFKAKCVMCHGGAQVKADVDLKTLDSAVKGGSSGDGAVPGKPDKSTLWLAIEDGSMPPPGKEKLTDAEKKLVKDWILSGAK